MSKYHLKEETIRDVAIMQLHGASTFDILYYAISEILLYTVLAIIISLVAIDLIKPLTQTKNYFEISSVQLGVLCYNLLFSTPLIVAQRILANTNYLRIR